MRPAFVLAALLVPAAAFATPTASPVEVQITEKLPDKQTRTARFVVSSTGDWANVSAHTAGAHYRIRLRRAEVLTLILDRDDVHLEVAGAATGRSVLARIDRPDGSQLEVTADAH